MKVTYYGHSCFAVAVGGKTLLFDPFITGNELAKAIDVKKVPADFILISHGHGDHVATRRKSPSAPARWSLPITRSPSGSASRARRKIHPLNHGGGYRFDFGRVKFVNAIHSSSCPTAPTAETPAALSSKATRAIFTTPATPR